jgi:hypothetical protein
MLAVPSNGGGRTEHLRYPKVIQTKTPTPIDN